MRFRYFNFLMPILKRRTNYQDKGNVVVLVAISLTTLLGFGALVTDFGMIYIEKARLQNSLDAAVLAGAQELPKKPQTALDVAASYGTRNGIALDSASVSENLARLTITSHKVVPTFLAKIWGIESNRINAKAIAAVVVPETFSGVAPLGIEKQNFLIGQPYILKSGSLQTQYDGTYYPGWFGPLDLGGTGASSYENDIIHGSDRFIKRNDILNIKTGNMSGPTQDAINTRLQMDQRDPPNTYSDYERDAPQILYVPVIEAVSRNGEMVLQVKVVGFAAFFVEAVVGNGNASAIAGRFIETIASNSHKIEGLNGTSNYGVYSVKLIN